MDRNAVATEVAMTLAAAERTVDTAIVDMAKLVGSISQARMELQISTATVDVAVTRATEAMAALAEARRAAGAAHAALRNVEQEFGLQVTGAGINCPPSQAIAPQQGTPLRVAS